MWKYVIAIIVFSLGLCACDEHRTSAPVVACRRTVLVYMEARNNLASEALDDLDEMRRGDVPADSRLLVYRSRRGEPNPVLCEVFEGGDSVLVNYSDTVLATDPKHMANVLADVRRLAPSREFGMVFWSHSSGWRQKASRGFGSENGRMMTVTDLALALGSDRAIDFLFFDCCYMGCAEVAYELRNCADYMVASPCEVPVGGMPYDLTLAELFNPDLTEGLKNAVDLTVDSYLADPAERCPSTLSVVDLRKMDELIEAVEPVLGNELPEGFKPQRFSRDNPYKYMFTDLGQYIGALGASIPDGVILHERHTPKIWSTIDLTHCSGLTIYMPDPKNGFDYTYRGYNTLSWAKYLHLNQ